MRKPKQITINSKDGRAIKILVKGGEDLRLDQRAQQMFSYMNLAMASDAECAHRKLQLRTYTVMPMTERTGAIEWVENTKILKEIIELGMTGMDKKKVKAAWDAPTNVNEAFLRKYKSEWPLMCEKATAAATTEDYQKRRDAIQNAVQGRTSKHGDSLIQSTLRKLSSGPEAYLMLKLGFTRSLATVNACQYLLGIGDRHLSNFMVDVTTGEVVGIDFGHAFGSATELLPIPELMPFRLTPELEAAMQPHSSTGLFRNCMAHVLRTMQDKQDTIIAIADVRVALAVLNRVTVNRVSCSHVSSVRYVCRVNMRSCESAPCNHASRCLLTSRCSIGTSARRRTLSRGTTGRWTRKKARQSRTPKTRSTRCGKS